MVTMPPHLNAADILKLALARDVAFVPCDEFFVGDARRNSFRLNFSNARPERIVTGIERLGAVLKEALQNGNG
jgi:2-aminoadipate transaminase